MAHTGKRVSYSCKYLFCRNVTLFRRVFRLFLNFRHTRAFSRFSYIVVELLPGVQMDLFFRVYVVNSLIYVRNSNYFHIIYMVFEYWIIYPTDLLNISLDETKTNKQNRLFFYFSIHRIRQTTVSNCTL